ncbi:MAG: hypothetical protein K8H88_32835, partial [Sandaracinaceae bacterium]|nr:hypothetical protein [Sandaracinaceae bacterium]
YGDVALCVRALDAADGPTLLERIQDSQWALVRAAKPGRTKYWFPRPTDREKPIYRRGERHLQVVGHDPRTGLMELSCVLGPGEHIQGWEIDDLRFAIHSKRIKRRKLTETRVVFLDREAAEREKRPLLDIGARVFVQEAQGDVEILG